jgi:hypothetical protein
VPASEESNGRAQPTDADAEAEQGVLANLPRTRPQRTTQRRVAAREAGVETAGAGAVEEELSALSGQAAAAHPGARKTRGSARTRKGATGKAARAAKPGSRSASAGAGAGGSSDRADAAGDARGAGTGGAPTATRRPRRARASSQRRPRAAGLAPAPRQGFEGDGERPSGPVQPPGGAELVASAAEIVSEVTKAGIAVGERLLKDVFSRIARS